jgi:hypothetical protein
MARGGGGSSTRYSIIHERVVAPFDSEASTPTHTHSRSELSADDSLGRNGAAGTQQRQPQAQQQQQQQQQQQLTAGSDGDGGGNSDVGSDLENGERPQERQDRWQLARAIAAVTTDADGEGREPPPAAATTPQCLIMRSLWSAIHNRRTLFGYPTFDLRSFFRAVDDDGSHTVTRLELGRALQRLDVPVTPEQLRELLSSMDTAADTSMDTDCSGGVNFGEFARWMTQSSFGENSSRERHVRTVAPPPPSGSTSPPAPPTATSVRYEKVEGLAAALADGSYARAHPRASAAQLAQMRREVHALLDYGRRVGADKPAGPAPRGRYLTVGVHSPAPHAAATSRGAASLGAGGGADEAQRLLPGGRGDHPASGLSRSSYGSAGGALPPPLPPPSTPTQRVARTVRHWAGKLSGGTALVGSRGGGATVGSPHQLVSPLLACIGSPCLRNCLHGASIGWRRDRGITAPAAGWCPRSVAVAVVPLLYR